MNEWSVYQEWLWQHSCMCCFLCHKQDPEIGKNPIKGWKWTNWWNKRRGEWWSRVSYPFERNTKRVTTLQTRLQSLLCGHLRTAMFLHYMQYKIKQLNWTYMIWSRYITYQFFLSAHHHHVFHHRDNWFRWLTGLICYPCLMEKMNTY